MNASNANADAMPQTPARRWDIGRLAIALNLALIAGMFGWLFTSGSARSSWETMEHGILDVRAAIYAMLGACLWAILAVTVAFGTNRERKLSRWLTLLALAACYLGLATSWRDVHWWGQRRRIADELPAYQSVAATLRAKWPKHDDATPELGAFSAYPLGAPRSLLLLSRRSLTPGGPPLESVERTPDGTLRFQLGGRETGSWLEWRRDDGPPQSFVDGLEEELRVERYASLGDGWFVLRYR
ncbi:MAG: hypothetical protein KDA61_20365 [Planctomycetales bacterium]|nr:hypothetical protein [Planctomycetales bacterium]